MKKNRRKKYFLSRSIQPRLLLGIAILVLISAIISGGLFYLLTNKELSTEYYKAHSTLRYVMQNLLPWLLLINMLAITVVLFFALFYTHRIAGPLYHIQEDIRKIAQGNLTTKIKTRRKDQLKELEAEINKMTERLNQSLQSVKETFFKLDGNLSELEEATKGKDLSAGELAGILEKIRSSRDEIDQKISLFKTE